VRLAKSPADPPVGHDVVEVTHQVGLGHHWQRLHVSLGHLTRVESGQLLAVPRRSLDGNCQQLPQGTQPLGAYLVPRPVDARDVFGQQPLEAGDMTPAQRLTGTIHRRVHAPILRDRGHLHIPSGRPSPGCSRSPLRPSRRLACPALTEAWPGSLINADIGDGEVTGKRAVFHEPGEPGFAQAFVEAGSGCSRSAGEGQLQHPM
jgi:hypothetical protein